MTLKCTKLPRIDANVCIEASYKPELMTFRTKSPSTEGLSGGYSDYRDELGTLHYPSPGGLLSGQAQRKFQLPLPPIEDTVNEKK
jgi:hypothetical protein